MYTMKALRSISLLLLLAFCLLTGCTPKTPIINNVDEREANEIIVFLASKGITAEKEPAVVSTTGGGGASNMWNILVNPQDATESLAILNRNGLPRRQGQNLLEIFGNTGLVPTDMQQKIRYEAGLSQQIANTIRQIDGVIDASVQLSFPPEGSTMPITAAVYVKHQGVLDNPNSQLVLKIKQLVAGSVAGLKLENVTVISDRSRFSDVSVMPSSAQQSDIQKQYITVWGVVVARESEGWFRTLFSLFLVVLFVLVLLLAWVFWKIYPLLEKEGGLSLFWRMKEENHKEPKKEPEEEHQETAPTESSEPPPPTNK